MANNDKHTAKWTIMIYMAVDDANGIPEARRFFKELDELKTIVPALTPDQLDYRDIRIFLQSYTNWETDETKPPNFTIRRYEINEEFRADTPLEEHLGSMGDSKELGKFIEWCKVNGTAEKHLLFLWGHGSGSSMFKLEDSYNNIKHIYPDLTLTDSETGLEVLIDDLSGPNNLFEKKHKKKIGINVNLKKGLGSSMNLTISARETSFYKGESTTVYDLINDNGELSEDFERLKRFLATRSSLDALLEKEISDGLKKAKIDVLLIMGCCMQMVEFGYELHDSKIQYYVASEELIYFDGYNYKTSFMSLSNNPDMTPGEFAQTIVKQTASKDTYKDYQRDRLAISAVDLTKSALLADRLDEFSATVIEYSKPNSIDKNLWKMIKTAREQCRHFGEDAYTSCFIDITCFLKKLRDVIVPEKNKYQKLFRILDYNSQDEDQMGIIHLLEKKYIVENHIGWMRSTSPRIAKTFGGHGVAIFFPSSGKAYSNSTTKEGKPFEKKNPEVNEFTRDRKWADFIQLYIKMNPDAKDDKDYEDLNRQQEDFRMKEKSLRSEINDWQNISLDEELKLDKIKTSVVADLLIENFALKALKQKEN